MDWPGKILLRDIGSEGRVHNRLLTVCDRVGIGGPRTVARGETINLFPGQYPWYKDSEFQIVTARAVSLEMECPRYAWTAWLGEVYWEKLPRSPVDRESPP